jgi:hypothetical protein
MARLAVRSDDGPPWPGVIVASEIDIRQTIATWVLFLLWIVVMTMAGSHTAKHPRQRPGTPGDGVSAPMPATDAGSDASIVERRVP